MFRSLQANLIRLLRWSEKYTGTDMVYLAHGSFWLSGSSVITGAISFGLALAFANLFSPHEYGTYKYILTLFGLLCVACLRGMDAVISQAAARGNDGTVITGLRAKMLWSLLGSVGAIAVAAYYFYGGNHVVAWAMLFGAVFIPLMEPFGVFNSVLWGKRNFRLSSVFGIAGQIFSALALIIALLITNNPIIIFIVYVGSWTISRYISLKITLHIYPPDDKHEPDAHPFAFHSSLVGISNALIASLDSILVYHYLGAAELALYAFAIAPVSHARAILNTPTILAVPKLAGQMSTSVHQMLLKRTRTLFLIGIGLTAAYCAVAYPFYLVFFPQYVYAVPYSLLFSTTILLQVATAYISAAIDSRLTLIPKRMLYLWNIPSVIVAACSLFLIPIFGLWGAIIGQVLSYASSSAIHWILWYVIKDKEHEPI